MTGMLPAKGVWWDPVLNLRIAVLSIAGGKAQVQVCRSSSPCPGEPRSESNLDTHLENSPSCDRHGPATKIMTLIKLYGHLYA